MNEPTDAELDRFRVASELRIACMRIARHIRTENAGDFAPHLYSVLATLEDGPRGPQELADIDGVAAPVMTRNLNELESEGLVHREQSPLDRRRVSVSLTQAGHDVIARVRETRDQWMVARVATVSDLEFTILKEAAGILHKIESE